ncbi:Uncharacterised protein [Actinomyces slackii]|uniref:Uncharacterized protein n=1 Tax=Actinomyces slackii TaxID=52774 RepID=A0A3S4SER3_9ACTO|nr:Uncharacterised protein [Actinomyces slackii]
MSLKVVHRGQHAARAAPRARGAARGLGTRDLLEGLTQCSAVRSLGVVVGGGAGLPAPTGRGRGGGVAVGGGPGLWWGSVLHIHSACLRGGSLGFQRSGLATASVRRDECASATLMHIHPGAAREAWVADPRNHADSWVGTLVGLMNECARPSSPGEPPRRPAHGGPEAPVEDFVPNVRLELAVKALGAAVSSRRLLGQDLGSTYPVCDPRHDVDHDANPDRVVYVGRDGARVSVTRDRLVVESEHSVPYLSIPRNAVRRIVLDCWVFFGLCVVLVRLPSCGPGARAPPR